MPGCSSLSTSLDAELISKQRGKTGFPVVNGLMGEDKTTFQKHLGQITQAQFVPQPPQNDEQDNISGIFQIIDTKLRPKKPF
jgi:ribosomal protein L27